MSAAYQHMENTANSNNEPRCLDWVFSNTSNIHVAKDRGWFTEYTPFETILGRAYGPLAQPIQVVGVGTVELLTEPFPESVGQGSPSTLRLTNVLHAPSVFCNILGGPILNDYHFIPGPFEDKKAYLADRYGRHVAYFDSSRPLCQLKLRDPPIGYHTLTHGSHYAIDAGWSDYERARWHARERILAGPLSVEEKTWLKERYYGDEFRFLEDHGLNIYKDEDRDEGRNLLRALMQRG